MTLFKRIVAVGLTCLVAFPQTAFASAPSFSAPDSPVISFLSEQALSAAAECFPHEDRSTRLRQASPFPSSTLWKTFVAFIRAHPFSAKFAGAIAVALIAHAVGAEKSHSLEASALVYTGLPRFLSSLPEKLAKFNPRERNASSRAFITLLKKKLADEDAATKKAKEESAKNALEEVASTAEEDAARKSDARVLSWVVKTVTHLTGRQDGALSLRMDANRILFRLLGMLQRLMDAPAEAAIAVADVIVQEEAALALLPREQGTWRVSWKTAVEKARAALDEFISELSDSPEEVPEEFWASKDLPGVDSVPVFTLYERLSRLRAFMKAGERANEQVEAIQEHRTTIDEALLEFAERTEKAELVAFVRNVQNHPLAWDAFVVRMHDILGLDFDNTSFSVVIETLETKCRFTSKDGKTVADPEEVEFWTQFAALYYFKYHLEKDGLFSRKEASGYPLVVASLENWDGRRVTKRIFDSSMIAAIVHNMEETEGAPYRLDALDPDVLTTVEALRYIAQQLAPGNHANDAPEMFRYLGQPREPGEKRPSDFLSTAWTARYWFYFLRQFSSQLQNDYPEWLVRFRSPKYHYARRTFPFSSNGHEQTIDLKNALSIVVQRIDQYRKLLERYNVHDLAALREKDRLGNDVDRTNKRLSGEASLMEFLENVEQLQSGSSENLQAFLAKQSFKPLDSSDGHVWIGEVGWHFLLVKFPDADSHVFDSLIRSNHATWVDLLDATVSPEKDTAAWISVGGLRVMALVPSEQPPSRAEVGTAPTLRLMVAAVRQGSAAAAEELVKRSKTSSSDEMIAFRRSLEEIATLTPDTASIHFGAEQLVEVAALVAVLLRATDARRSWHAKRVPESLQDWFPENQRQIWETVATRIKTWPSNQSLQLLQSVERKGAVFAYGNPTNDNPEFHLLGMLGGDFDAGNADEKTWITMLGSRLQQLLNNVFPGSEKKIRLEDELLVIRYADQKIGDLDIGVPKKTRLQLLKATVEKTTDYQKIGSMLTACLMGAAVASLISDIPYLKWVGLAVLFVRPFIPFDPDDSRSSKGIVGDQGSSSANLQQKTTGEDPIALFQLKLPGSRTAEEVYSEQVEALTAELEEIEKLEGHSQAFNFELEDLSELLFFGKDKVYVHMHTDSISGVSWFFPLDIDELSAGRVVLGQPLAGIKGMVIPFSIPSLDQPTALVTRDLVALRMALRMLQENIHEPSVRAYFFQSFVSDQDVPTGLYGTSLKQLDPRTKEIIRKILGRENFPEEENGPATPPSMRMSA